MKLAFITLVCLTAWSCTQPVDEGVVVFALDSEMLRGPTADPGTPMLDESGIAHLDRFPAFLVIRVEADDLESPIITHWPTEVPEELPEVVTLDLSVPAGMGRRVAVDLVLADDVGFVTTWIAPAINGPDLITDVAAGEDVEIDVPLSEVPRGTITATWDHGYSVEGLSWVDDSLGATLPTMSPIDEAVTTELAVGRLYWPRVVLTDGSTLDLPEQSVSITREGERSDVTLNLGI